MHPKHKIKQDDVTFSDMLQVCRENVHDACIIISDSVCHPCKTVHEISKEITSEALTVFVGIQTIGCWKGGGWAVGVVSNFPSLVPFIPQVFNTLDLQKITEAAEEILNCFPKNADFQNTNTQEFCDIINSLERHDKSYRNAINSAENLVEEIWAYDAANAQGFGPVLDYFSKNLDAKVWK